MDPLRLSLTKRITPASPKCASPQPSRSLNQTPSTKASRQHKPPSKYSPTKKKQRSFKRNLTCRRRSSTSVEGQYIEELNEEYFGYANSTIKNVLYHLRTNWCKVMTRECTDATKAFYQAWVPNMTHIITFGRKLNKQQKKLQDNQCHHF